MKYINRRRGIFQSCSDRGESCDSSISLANLDINVDLVLQVHEANMDNVAVKSENGGKNKKDPCASVNGKLSSTSSIKSKSSKLASQELFLSHLKMGPAITVETSKIKVKPDTVLKKTRSAQQSTRYSLPDKLNNETVKMKTNTSACTIKGKCMVQNKDDWNKYMLGKVKPPKSKTPKSCTNVQNKIDHVDIVDTRQTPDKATEEISSHSINNSDIYSPKAKKSRIQKINNVDNSLLNIDSTIDSVVNNSESCSSKINKSKIKKLINRIDNAFTNIDNTEDEIVNNSANCSPKTKKTKIQKKINSKDIILHNTKGAIKEVINSSNSTNISSPVSKKSGTKNLNKIEDFTNDNADPKYRSSRRIHKTRNMEFDKKSDLRKRKISDTSNIDTVEDTVTEQEINTKIKKASKNSLIDSDFTSKNAVNEPESSENLDATKSTMTHRTKKSQENSDIPVNSVNNNFEINSPKFKKSKASNLNFDVPVSSDADQMNNSSEIHSPKLKKTSSEATKCDLVRSISEDNLLVPEIKNSKNDKCKMNFEIPEAIVTTELIDTGVENRDITNEEQESHRNDKIEELRNKYSILLNCNLNPYVPLERLIQFSNSLWISKQANNLSENATSTNQDQTELSVKVDPEDSLHSSSDSTLIKTEEMSPMQLRNARVVLHSFKLEKQPRAIIKLNRNWNLSKAKHRSRSGFKYKFTNDLVLINSRNNIFRGAQLVEGINDISSEKSSLTENKVVRKETADKSDHSSNKEINKKLSLAENDSAIKNSTTELQKIETVQILLKSTDKLDNSNKIIHRTESQEKLNSISSEKLNTVKTLNEKCNKSLDTKINLQVGETSVTALNDSEKNKKSEKSIDKLHKTHTKIPRSISHEKVCTESLDNINENKEKTQKCINLKDTFEYAISNDKHIKFNEKIRTRSISKEKIVVTALDNLEKNKTLEKSSTETTKKHENKQKTNTRNKSEHESKSGTSKLEKIETLTKLPPNSNDKVNLTNNEICIKSSQKLNNELKKIEINKIVCDKKFNDILPTSEKTRSTEKSVNIDSSKKSKKEERVNTYIKTIQTDDTKINENMLKRGNDATNNLKQKIVKHESLVKNKESNKKHKPIKSEISHKTEIESFLKIKDSKVKTNLHNENKEKNSMKGIESVSEELSTNKSDTINEKPTLINIENKKMDTNYEDKDHSDKTIKPTIEKSQTEIETGKVDDEQKKLENAVEILQSTKKQLPIENNSPFSRPKHVFKFLEKCDIKRPPSRMARKKIVLNRPTLDDTFKVPLSPKSQPIKSEFAPRSSPRKLDKDSSQTVSSELLAGVSPKKIEREFDSISIYADTIGVESVADTASVRYDSDGDNDFCDDLPNILPEIEEVKHTEVNKWVENTVCEIQKHTKRDINLLDKLNELSTSKENGPDQFEKKTQKETSSKIVSPRIDVIVEEVIMEHDQLIEEVPAKSDMSTTSCNVNKYHALDIFRYMCANIKRRGECNKKVQSCQFKHELPTEWKNELKNSSVESVLALYDNAKEKHFVFLFKKIFPTITELLGDKRDLNNLIKMVKDVLEIDMNSDRAPFINDIINALCKTGVTFHSIVELVYKNTNVNDNLVNLLSDILLNLTVEKGDANGNWKIIKELMYNRNYDIDNGIIQSIIIESLEKDISEKDLIARVYQDLLKNISNRKLSSIFESLLNNFYNRLVKYNMSSEANEFFGRCQSLNITLGNKSDHSDSPCSISTVSSPAGKSISKVPPFQNTLKRDPKFENMSPISASSNVLFVSPINFSQPPPPLNSGVENIVPHLPTTPSSPAPLFPFPPPTLPPQLFIKPPPPTFKQKPLVNTTTPSPVILNKEPVVNQKMPWYTPQARSRQKLHFDHSAPSGSSTSGIPYTPIPPKCSPQTLLLNKDEVKRAIHEENISRILSLIVKFKDNQFTDLFIKTSIEAMLETNHSFPTFFGNLCQNANYLISLNDKTLAYVFTTIGLNIILHLTQSSNWDQAYILYKIVRSNFGNDIFNVKLYLPEKYTYFKRIMIITLIHVKKFKFDAAWSMLREFDRQYNRIWQGEITESEISYRNSIIDELLAAVTMKKFWHLGLKIVQDLIKYNVSGVDIKKYINDILLQAINKKCTINELMEFVNCSSNWYNYVSKHIFRAIVAHTAAMSCWSLAKSFYIIGCNFEVYPQLIGNERFLSFSIHYIFEEIQLLLEIFFEKMINFRPIKHNVMIRVVDELQIIPTAELPLILQQYQMSATIMQVRIINILNNHMKPAITINKQNNAIVITAEILNKHLEGRMKARLDT